MAVVPIAEPALTRVARAVVTLAAALVVLFACDRASKRAAASSVHALPSGDPEMVLIPAGAFLMGSSRGDDDETPVHRVALARFSIDRTEVTAGAYQRCVAAGACRTAGRDSYCTTRRPQDSTKPINCVAWDQASAFCSWRGERLPTEAEWEYAARGTDGRTYPWGEDPPKDQLCWDGPGSDLGLGRRRGTCAVGSFPAGASPFGVLDMAGNVWEWTSDRYTAAYGEAPTELYVVRGGTWFGYDRADVRTTLRFRIDPKRQDYGVGFRCARSE